MNLVLPPLAAETMFQIGNFPITNSYINSSLALLGFLIFAIFIQKSIKKYYSVLKAPKGILNFTESNDRIS